MEEVYYYQETFTKVVALQQFLTNKEFDDCLFTNCDFANSHFSSSSFTDCTFADCNLSLVQLKNSGLKNVRFINCKLMSISAVLLICVASVKFGLKQKQFLYFK